MVENYYSSKGRAQIKKRSNNNNDNDDRDG